MSRFPTSSLHAAAAGSLNLRGDAAAGQLTRPGTTHQLVTGSSASERTQGSFASLIEPAIGI